MSVTLDIIIPVRDMAPEIGDCLATLIPQLSAADRVTVVDDGSADATVAVARSGGAVVITQQGRGPYAARHAAALRSDRSALLFVDARCRARDGLVEAHRRLLADPAVALSCTNVAVRPGRSLAARTAVARDPYRLSLYLDQRGRLDFFPTANLGVRHSAYEAVGGFRDMRSGGDADLCWRIQTAGLGRLAADNRTLMDWEPRAGVGDLFEQWRRYGTSRALLEQLYPSTGTAELDSGQARGDSIGALIRRCVKRPADIPVVALAGMTHAAYLAEYRRSRRRIRRDGFIEPRLFDPAETR